MTKVAFLLNNEFQFDNRVLREAESLCDAGYEVTIFCVAAPSLPKYEQRGALSIRRVLPKPLKTFEAISTRHVGGLLRILTDGQGPFDIVQAHDSNTLLLGWALSRLWKARFVYDSHELWESVFEFELNETARKAKENRKSSHWLRKRQEGIQQARDLEAWLLPKCDAIISVNETLCQLLNEKAQKPPEACVSLRNIIHRYELQETRPRRFHQHFGFADDTQIVLYQGDIKATRGIEPLFEAMTKVTRADVALVLMGPIPDAQYEAQLRQTVKNTPSLNGRVFFKERVDVTELLSWTASADLGVAPILNSRASYYYCLPNKLFEYIQAEIPCVTSNFPEMSRLVEGYDVGSTLDPEDSNAIAAQITAFFESKTLLNHYKINLRKAKEELNWENEQQKLLNLYQHLKSV